MTKSESEEHIVYRVEKCDGTWAGTAGTLEGAKQIAQGTDEANPLRSPHHIRKVPADDVRLTISDSEPVVYPITDRDEETTDGTTQ